MTREEAIEKLELMRQKVDEETYRALILAIKALEQEPCTDAVSKKSAVRCVLSSMFLAEASEKIEKLPSVTQKSGKWDRLYSWLNDMRLSIAPDETVTDIDERHCRESQTDILDEIMEWMIKAEKER